MHFGKLTISAVAPICAIAILALVSPPVDAQTAFIPPNDTNGHVFSNNSNDGYNAGRGIVFNTTANTTLSSVGIFQDLTNVVLNYDVAQVTTTNGQVDTGEIILRSGSRTVTTSGLQFIDFSFANLLLAAGKNYQIEFTFNGASNQNFFYNNDNKPWTQGSFALLDGTQAGDATNFVVPAIRVSAEGTSVTPEGSSLAMLVLGGLPLVVGFGRKFRRKTA